MTNMKLPEIFMNVAVQMLADFEAAKAAIHHSGLKGSEHEETVKKFLKKYLPKSIEISSGIVVDSFGNASKQLDVILHDTYCNPVFYESPTTRVIPVEGVYAAIEVKSEFNASEQKKAFENMLSFKQLKKVAYFPEPGPIYSSFQLYGTSFSSWPLMYFVFAFESPNLSSVIINLSALQVNNLPHQRIDTVCVLKQGVLLNRDESTGLLSALPSPTSIMAGSATTQPLFFFYTLISVLLTQAKTRPFNLLPYIEQAQIAF